jgi:uncharacterized repeat protein (TIGR03803 family)
MLTKSRLSLLLLQLALAAIALTSTEGAWATPTYKVLYAFSGEDGAGGLWGSLLLDGSGNLYGPATENVFKLTPQAAGEWNVTFLHRFGYGNDGSIADAGLIFDPSGNLYGTTTSGGGSGKNGTVFELSPEPDGSWKETVLYRFVGGGGVGADGGVVRDSKGNLYGPGLELSPGPKGWRLKVLHKFPSYQGDGVDPYAVPVMDASGNLYGATQHGGSSHYCDAGCGTVYELSPKRGGKWEERILHSFGSYPHDGSLPKVGALALDGSGNLYGTTADGGTTGSGVIFKLSPASGGKWHESILYNIPGGAEGDEPAAGVVMDQAGNLYGTTIAGGSGCDCGVVYELSPGKNGEWKYTVLHTFVGSDGAEPDANLILDGKGNLYGTTATGGSGGAGVAFELTP